MKIGLMSILLIISTVCVTSLNAQTEAVNDSVQTLNTQQFRQAIDPLDLEIGEMIFDETITKVGRDFYEIFFNSWSNPTGIRDFSISISEMPMPGVGTQITVTIDETVIVKQFVRPNQEMIEMLAEYTVGLAGQYLMNYQDIQLQLQSDDQSGTGIF